MYFDDFVVGQCFHVEPFKVTLNDIKEFANLEFLDIKKINILDYDDIRYLYDEGYELPYCAIDGVVRFYGGISSRLIYKDIKELV
jgi:hypothetical protein